MLMHGHARNGPSSLALGGYRAYGRALFRMTTFELAYYIHFTRKTDNQTAWAEIEGSKQLNPLVSDTWLPASQRSACSRRVSGRPSARVRAHDLRPALSAACSGSTLHLQLPPLVR
jgi:hypothetical protein